MHPYGWTSNPTNWGGDGQRQVLGGRAPTLLTTHSAPGPKHQTGPHIFYEPLASYDPEGNLFPVLAAEVPSVQNGGVSKDGRSVTWKLKKGVTWHDGKPFTSADVVFNWEFVKDPKTAARTIGSYTDIDKIDVLDSHTVRLVFKKPVPFWANAFCGVNGMIIPKHLFEPYMGEKPRG